MLSRHNTRHLPRHAASRGYRDSRRHSQFRGLTSRGRRSRLTLGVIAATAAGAAVVAGITVSASLGAIRTGSAARPAAAPPAAALSTTGAGRQNHPAAESDSPLQMRQAGTRSPAHSTSPQARPAAQRTSSAKAAAAGKHQAGGKQRAGARPTASASPRPSRSSGPSKPYEFYDSVEPQTVPAGAIVATYSTGARPVPASAVAGRKRVLWIDTLATDPAGSGALDVEPGCATPAQVPAWVSSRLRAHPDQVAIVYMSLSEWPQVQADVASLPKWMRSRIRWWVADPTGVPHLVPGSQATQWYWGSTYDESMAAPDFDPDLVRGPSTR